MSGDINSQAFWNEFMRRPDAKAAYQAERRLQEKKHAWLQERRVIEERGGARFGDGQSPQRTPLFVEWWST